MWAMYNSFINKGCKIVSITPKKRKRKKYNSLRPQICARCKKKKKLTKDHIIPQRLYKYYSKGELLYNIQYLCRPCHDIKEKMVVEIISNGKRRLFNKREVDFR